MKSWRSAPALPGERSRQLRRLFRQYADIHLPEEQLLARAAARAEAEAVRALLECGASPAGRDAAGLTALQLAAAAGSSDCVVELVNAGAGLDCRAGGRTALQLAAAAGHQDIASILINRGADTGLLDSEGCTALDLARAGRELRARLVGQAGAVAGILTALATPPRPGHPTVLIMLGQVWF